MEFPHGSTSSPGDASLTSVSEHYAVNPAGGVIDTRDGEEVASVSDLFPGADPEDPKPSAPASAPIPHDAEALSLFGAAILDDPAYADAEEIDRRANAPEGDFSDGFALLDAIDEANASTHREAPDEEAISPVDAGATLDGLADDPDAIAQAMASVPMSKAELAADLLASIPKMDDDSLGGVGGDIETMIADIRVRHEAELAEHIKMRAAVFAEIEKRVLGNLSEEQIRAQTGKSIFLLPAPSVEAGVEIKRDTAKFMDVLRGLKGLVSDEEFDAAVYQEKLPKPEDVPWTANMTKLKALVKKYGEKSKVGEIVRKGTVYREQSRRVFLRPVEQEPRNVTPIAKALAAGEAA